MTDEERSELTHDFEELLVREEETRVAKAKILEIARKINFSEADELEADLDAILAKFASVREMLADLKTREGLV